MVARRHPATNIDGPDPPEPDRDPRPGRAVPNRPTPSPRGSELVDVGGRIPGRRPTEDDAHPLHSDPGGGRRSVGLGAPRAAPAGASRRLVPYVTNVKDDVDDVTDAAIADNDADVASVNPDMSAPFATEHKNGLIYVTYAKRDLEGKDDVPGPGHRHLHGVGTDGDLRQPPLSPRRPHSPRGPTRPPNHLRNPSGAPARGEFGGWPLPGHHLHTGPEAGPMTEPDRHPPPLGGPSSLHTLGARSVYFTAGIVEESHGLFGAIRQSR